MSPDKFLELNSPSFFYCSKTKCRLTYAECVRRQDLVKKQTHLDSGMIRQKWGLSYDYKTCFKCDEGRKNRKLAKKMKVVNVDIPGKFEVDQTKTCPCGTVFVRPKNTRPQAWGQMKYCPTHRAMKQNDRAKDLMRIKAEKINDGHATLDDLKSILAEEKAKMETNTPMKTAVKIVSDTEKKANKGNPVHPHEPRVETQNLTQKNDSEDLDPAMEGETWKRCSYSGCSRVFYRGDENAGTWASKKYCNANCSRDAENARAREQTKKAKKMKEKEAKRNVCENAQDIAAEVFEEMAPLVTLGCSVDELDRMKAVCLVVGAACIRRAL